VASGQFTIQVGTFDVLGIKDVVATGEIKPVPTVGTHQAVQSIYGTVCAISIEVTRTSRVDIGGAANGDTAKSCQIAMQVARLVEPKLPGGS
jgi:hypothetical protein